MHEPDRTATRPRHTTVAAGLIIGGSALAVLGVVDQLVGLHSLDTRQALEKFLRRPPGSDLGLDLASARSVLRVLLMVVAACATASLVLGFGVLRRDHRSRLALTVLAVPLFVGGLVTGGLWTSIIASASVFLWLGPSGDWFAGRAPQQPAAQADRPAMPERPQLSPADPSVRQPPPPDVRAPLVGLRQRPAAVLTACVLTWSLSGAVIGLMSLTLAVVVASPDTLWREALRQQPALTDQGLSRSEMLVALEVLGGVFVLWAAVAIILGSLVYRGSNGARIALAVSGYAAALVCLLGTLSSPLLLVPLLICATGASLLLRPESRAWCQPGRR